VSLIAGSVEKLKKMIQESIKVSLIAVNKIIVKKVSLKVSLINKIIVKKVSLKVSLMVVNVIDYHFSLITVNEIVLIGRP
jgi:hypothetical protein